MLFRSPLDKLSKTLIDAALIRIATNMSFPEFTNQGQYLEIHPLLDIVKYLGGPDDDFQNHFTARMLLLLESRPVYNARAYATIVEAIVAAYFRDYRDHEKDFRPIFFLLRERIHCSSLTQLASCSLTWRVAQHRTSLRPHTNLP